MRKLFYFVLWLGLFGCDDFCDNYLTKEPTSEVASGNYWKTETDVENAVRQVYAQYAQTFGSPTIRLYRNRGLPFDYLSSSWLNVSKNYLQLKWGKNAPQISWSEEYNVISEANKVLHYIDRAEMPRERRDNYVAQLKTMRAIVHLYIATTWGDCPYEKDYFDIGPVARMSQENVFDNCIADLEESVPFLFPASGIKNADGSLNRSKQIPSRGTALAFLAETYARKGVKNNDPAFFHRAITAADSVINSGDYNLVSTVKDVCETVLKGNSCEGIYEIDFYDIDGETNNHNASMFAPTVQYPVVPNSTPATNRSGARLSYGKAKEMFSPLDDWWENAFYKPEEMKLLPENQTRGAVYIYKHRNILIFQDGSQKGRIRALDENEIILRLPDMYLLAAEMYARLGNAPKAKEYLNVIRRRANGPDYSEPEGDLMRAIFKTWVKERFMEGFDFEYYLRMRFGYIHELPGDFGTVTDPESWYLPVGVNAFNRNPLMKQNTYWITKGY